MCSAVVSLKFVILVLTQLSAELGHMESDLGTPPSCLLPYKTVTLKKQISHVSDQHTCATDNVL